MRRLANGWSELCLGTSGFGPLSATACGALLDAFATRGGNLVEVSPAAEEHLGAVLAGRRSEFVLCSRWSAPGALEGSLRRLRTDHVDVLFVHGWDGTVPVDALIELVRSGLARAVGLADAPAWAVAQLHTRLQERAGFGLAGVTLEYGLAARDAERELLPMCRALGLAPLAWGNLSGDWLLGAQRPKLDATDDYYAAHRKAAATRLAPLAASIADRRGVTTEALLLRWTLEAGVIPMLGATSLDALHRRLGCLDFALEAADRAELDAASRITLGFPRDYLAASSG